MDGVQKYASTNANTPSSETYRSDSPGIVRIVKCGFDGGDKKCLQNFGEEDFGNLRLTERSMGI
jgi:hypothetical protein